MHARQPRRQRPDASQGQSGTLLVASSGGHLKELALLRSRMDVDGRVDWVTSDTRQSRSMLEREQVHFVAPIASRDLTAAFRALPRAWRILRDGNYARVISTGSAVALVFLPLARLSGRETHYIESAARLRGPSLTGRLLQTVPGVNLHTQAAGWAGGRWRFAGSVFDGFEPAGPVEVPPRLERVVVTVGTQGFFFHRLVERLLGILPSDASVVWQTGATDASALRIDGRSNIPESELAAAMRAADIVVAHAGVGSALTALETGHCPILVPRRFLHGEHVDDHQTLIASELADRGLAVYREVEELTVEDLWRAARMRVQKVEAPPPLRLDA